MKLFDATPSPNCRRVRVLARELGLALELLPTRPGATDAAYLALNPSGKVPTLLEDDGFILWESGAILIYLAEKQRSELWPDEPHARAEITRWMFFTATHVQPWVSVLGQERLLKPRLGREPDAASVSLAERELARFLPILEQRLATRDYLAEGYSLADIFVGSTFETLEARGVTLVEYAALTAWRERLRARPAWRD